MKGNRLKKVLSIILLITILVMALNVTVSARYQYIGLLAASLTIGSNGYAMSDGLVLPSDRNTETILTVELQKNSSGAWIKENSWSVKGTAMSTITLSSPTFVIRGTYRVVVTAQVYSLSGTLLETQSMTSSTVTY